MALKNNKLQNRDRSSGQSALEFIFVFLIIFTCTLSVIEISRLLSFKNALHGAILFAAQEILYSQVDIDEKGFLPHESKVTIFENSKFKNSIKSKILSQLEFQITSKLSWDNSKNNGNSSEIIKINNHNIRIDGKYVYQKKDSLYPGIYIEAQTCLPVLFSSYFNNLLKGNTLGKKGFNEERTCLGQYTKKLSNAIFWYHIRTSVFIPWSSSLSIYHHGLGIPDYFSFAEEGIKKDVSKFLLSEDFSSYLEE